MLFSLRRSASGGLNVQIGFMVSHPSHHGDVTDVTDIISSDVTDVNMKIDNPEGKVYNHIEI